MKNPQLLLIDRLSGKRRFSLHYDFFFIRPREV